MTSLSDTPETTDAAPPASARTRRPWSLQAKLMGAIIGMVALILVCVGVSTSAILSQVLQANLDNRIVAAMRELTVAPSATAVEVLETSRQVPGTVLVIGGQGFAPSGAYVGSDLGVEELSPSQLDDVVDAVVSAESATVALPSLGDYRVSVVRQGGFVAVLGLPLSEVSGTIAQILTVVGLVTAGGLLLLSVVIAIVIRAGLKPLRAVAETATRVASVRMDQGDVSITERVPDDEADPHTEIGQVGAALNTLLDHVDSSLTARQRNEELMRRFVADASHELRTPLASIRGYSELSLRALGQGAGASTAETTQSALERIQAQSLRMTTLVEDLLLLARLDEGQELVYGSVDLTQLALEAVGDARPAGPDHEWAIEVPDEPVVLAGDVSRLNQVIANLLANARTHTPAGTTVTVSVARDGRDAVLRVHDDGPGVDPAIADELFERFARGDRSRARQTGGTGLGLSIARAIVDAHDGTLTVRSAPGDTTFELRLPAKPDAPV